MTRRCHTRGRLSVHGVLGFVDQYHCQADVCTSRVRDELLIKLHALMRRQGREAVVSASAVSTCRDFGYMPVVELCG